MKVGRDAATRGRGRQRTSHGLGRHLGLNLAAYYGAVRSNAVEGDKPSIAAWRAETALVHPRKDALGLLREVAR